MDNQNKKICMKCGVPITPGSAFCTACGAPFPADERKICMKCGVPIAPGSAFCTACGAPAPGADTPETPQAALSPEELNKRSYENALKLVEAKQYEAALNLFTKLGDYEDSKKRAEECKAAAEEARKEATYASAVALLSAKNVTEAQLKQGIASLKGISDYKDSKNQASKLEKCLDDLVAAKKKKKSKTIKIVIIAAIAFVLLAATGVALIILNIPYNLQVDRSGAGWFEEIEYNMLTDDIVLEPAEIPGYEFIGWMGSDLDGLTKEVVIKKFSSGNRSYQAHYAPKKYTVTLDANGGTCEASTYQVEYEGSYNLPTPTKTGYTFEGWYDGDKRVYNDGSWYTMNDVSLKAKWSVNSYNLVINNSTHKGLVITFSNNYDGDNFKVVTQPTGCTLYYPDGIPEREGYVFTGWYTDAECKNRYDFTGKITGDMTLYAGWLDVTVSGANKQFQINAYAFNSNYDAYSLWLNNSTITSKTYAYMVANESGTHYIYFRNDYSGSNYAYYLEIKNMTTNTVIKASSLIDNVEYDYITFECEANDIIELSFYNKGYNTYAYLYTVGFKNITSEAVTDSTDLEYHSSSTTASTHRYGDEYTLPVITKPGHTFLGWYNGETKLDDTGIWNFETDITIEAKWEAIPYTITLNPDGGTLTSNTVSVIYGENYELPTPVKKGHTFLGWYNGDTKLLNGRWTGLEDITLVAKWAAKTYKVTLNDVTTNSYATVTLKNNYDDAYYENFDVISVRSSYTLYTSSVPTRSGYVFTGWYTDPECEKPFDLATPIVENMELYAGWTKLLVSDSSTPTQLNPISYNYNNSRYYSLSTSGTQVGYRKSVVVTATETGIHAIYYRNSSSTKSYSYSIRIYNKTDNKVLFQTSVASTSWAHYDFHADAGDIIVISIYKPTDNKDSTAYLSFGGFMLSSRLEGDPVYAYSEDATYTLSSSTKFGDEITLPTPVRSGYKFLGWYYNDTKVESGKWNLDAETTSVTLTPKWEEIK